MQMKRKVDIKITFHLHFLNNIQQQWSDYLFYLFTWIQSLLSSSCSTSTKTRLKLS